MASIESITIDHIIQGEECRSIVEAPDFYFQKGQDALNKWLDMEVREELKLRLLELSTDYHQLQKEATGDPEIKVILELLLEIIAYCDAKAKDKHKYNQYADKRVLALAAVRMTAWVQHLIQLKFQPDTLGKGSTSNAFKYLLDPENNTSILSENHRELIAKNLLKKEFDSNNFINDLKYFFVPLHLSVKNPLNYTHLLSRIIYSLTNKWKEEVVALIAADSTGWQDDYIEEAKEYTASIIWNSKRPTGTNETIKFLQNRVNEGGSFNLYYAKKGMVHYKASIIDFAENQQELDNKKWLQQYELPYFYHSFGDYIDGNKSAKIIFLAEKMEKISPISIDEFKFYKKYQPPTQDNLSPLTREPETVIEQEKKALHQKENNMPESPLNQIFYGPPGTGKTYKTIERALRIINDEEIQKLDWSNREAVKKIFDKKVREGQIIFSTFHQTMSYEDFIEGIKPLKPLPGDTSVTYDIVDGIFKKACAIAAYNSHQLFIESKAQRPKYEFEDLYVAFIDSIKTEIAAGTLPVFKTLRGKDVEVKEINNNDSIIARAKNSSSKSSAPLTEENIQKLYDKFKSIDEIENLRQVQETVQVSPRITEFYAVFSGLKAFEKTFKPDEDSIAEGKEIESQDIEEILKKFNAGVYTEAVKTHGKNALPVILIVDEINRGNIAQIFGELITLIEDDKRLGRPESLEVTLPYSKEKLGVPPNLYIIGTMNTADRSVEALDAALRRRFSFEEMPPQPNKIPSGNFGGVNLPSLFITINKRIEKLLDKDHQIGHSYFMGVDNLEMLQAAFYNKIIPLLQEYFFGAYDKMGLVLGDGFVRIKNDAQQIFADFDTDSAADLEERPVYEIIDYRKADTIHVLKINNQERAMNFPQALKRLMRALG